jgi:hypothetical protein
MRTLNIQPGELEIENFWFCDLGSLTLSNPDVEDNRVRHPGSVQRWGFVGNAVLQIANAQLKHQPIAIQPVTEQEEIVIRSFFKGIHGSIRFDVDNLTIQDGRHRLWGLHTAGVQRTVVRSYVLDPMFASDRIEQTATDFPNLFVDHLESTNRCIDTWALHPTRSKNKHVLNALRQQAKRIENHPLLRNR